MTTTLSAPSGTAVRPRDGAERFVASQHRVIGVLPSPNDLSLMAALASIEASIVFARPPRSREALRAMHVLGCRFSPEKIVVDHPFDRRWHFRAMPSALLAQQPVEAFFLIGLGPAQGGRLALRRGWRCNGGRPGIRGLRNDCRTFLDLAASARVIENPDLRWRVRNHVR